MNGKASMFPVYAQDGWGLRKQSPAPSCSSPGHSVEGLPWGLYRVQMLSAGGVWLNLHPKPMCGDCGDSYMADKMDLLPLKQFRLLPA